MNGFVKMVEDLTVSRTPSFPTQAIQLNFIHFRFCNASCLDCFLFLQNSCSEGTPDIGPRDPV